MSRNPGTSRPADVVREAVSSAEQRRRRREAARQLWRAAPLAAIACLAIAILGRWMHWSVAVPISALVIGIAAAGAFVLYAGRVRPLSDVVAASIDADAGLGGELRSAAWFAAKDTRDEWMDYHLARAAERVQAQNWTALYPAYRATRERLLTGALAVAVVALVVTWPGRAGIAARVPVASAVAPAALPDGAGLITPVPEDLRKQIEDLLAAAEKGTMSAQQQTKTAAKLWNYMATFNLPDDPEALKQLAKMMDPNQKGSADDAARKMLELADKANKAADADSIPPELRKAMQDLGSQLSEAAEAEQHSSEKANQQNGASKDATPGEAAADAKSADLDKSSIQFSKDNNASAGASMMMLSEQPGQPGGGSASGYGGAGGSKAANNGTMPPQLQQALRRETVEANTDTAGDNVLSETRHKTEHTSATVGFAGTAPGAHVQAPAAAPPPIPEDRRSVVETYFTRKQ